MCMDTQSVLITVDARVIQRPLKRTGFVARYMLELFSNTKFLYLS